MVFYYLNFLRFIDQYDSTHGDNLAVLLAHWQIGAGYEFGGKNGLSRAAKQTLNNGLTLNHLYQRGFNLTYFA
jgi:hypothetical protein